MVMQKSKNQKQTGMLKRISTGVGVCYAASLLVLFIFAVLINGEQIEEDSASVGVYFAIGLGSFVGSVVCGKLSGGKFMLSAICCGAAVMLLRLAISLFTNEGNVFDKSFLISLVIVMIASLIGGIFAGKKRKKHKSR